MWFSLKHNTASLYDLMGWSWGGHGVVIAVVIVSGQGGSIMVEYTYNLSVSTCLTQSDTH